MNYDPDEFRRAVNQDLRDNRDKIDINSSAIMFLLILNVSLLIALGVKWL
jgi:hypothetical protein